MYKVKPYQDELVLTDNLPTCMYKVKPYCQTPSATSSDSPVVYDSQTIEIIESINKRTEKQLILLERLNKKTNDICDELNLNDLKLNDETKLNLNKDDLLESLNRQQLSQFKRLDRLTQKLNNLCDDLNLSNLKLTSSNENSKAATNTTNLHHQQQQQQQQPQHAARINKNLLDKVSLESLLNVKRVTSSKVNKQKSTVDDYAITLNVSNEATEVDAVIPYLILNYFNQLTLNYKCFIRFHLHGTILNAFRLNKNTTGRLESTIRNVIELFENRLMLGLNEPRNCYDVAFTVTWKLADKESGPSLNFSQPDKAPLFDEEAIIDFVNKSSAIANKNLQPTSIKGLASSSELTKVIKSI